MYKYVTLVAGIVFLGAAAFLWDVIERTPDGASGPAYERIDGRVPWALVIFGAGFVWLGLRDIFFPGPKINEAIRRRRDRDAERGDVRAPLREPRE